MSNVGNVADDFIARAHTGKRVSVSMKLSHAENFLELLARGGVVCAKACLDAISDPELKRIVETLFFSTTAGAVVGGVVGFALGGPAGAQTGALVGGAAGLAIGVAAVTIQIAQRGDRIVITAN